MLKFLCLAFALCNKSARKIRIGFQAAWVLHVLLCIIFTPVETLKTICYLCMIYCSISQELFWVNTGAHVVIN